MHICPNARLFSVWFMFVLRDKEKYTMHMSLFSINNLTLAE